MGATIPGRTKREGSHISHVAEGACKIYDLDALAEAAEAVGMELVLGQKEYAWYGRWLNDWNDPARAAALRGHDPKTFGKSEHVLRVKGQRGGYEVGVVNSRDDDGGFELIYDAFGVSGHRLEEVGGVGMEKVADEYNAAVTARELARQGYRIRRVVNEDNEIEVIGVKA